MQIFANLSVSLQTQHHPEALIRISKAVTESIPSNICGLLLQIWRKKEKLVDV